MASLGFSIIAKTGKQQQVKIPVSGREVLQPFTWYTCPAGKRAICIGRVQCTGRGAAATADFDAAFETMFRWTSVATPQGFETSPRNLSDQTDEFAFFNVELAAGETIVTDQNVGTNAEFNLWMEVEELPV